MGVASTSCLCFRCMQAITADTDIAYITHDDRPNTSSASRRHGTKRHGGLYIRSMPACITLITLTVILNPNQWTDVCDSSYRGESPRAGANIRSWQQQQQQWRRRRRRLVLPASVGETNRSFEMNPASTTLAHCTRHSFPS